MKFIHLVWRNLMRKKLRSAFTLGSIVVAFVLFGFLSAIKEALTGGVSIAGANRLIVRNKVSIIQFLPHSYQEKMERIPGVSLVTSQTWFGGIYQDPKNFFMQCPVEPESFLEMFPEFILPPDEKAAWLRTRTGAIVGRKTAERFGWKIGDKIPIRSTIWTNSDGTRTWIFDLVGIFDGREKNTDTTPLFFRYDYFDEVRNRSQPWGHGQVGWFTIRVRDPAQAAQVAQAVDAEFENSSAETKTEPEGAFVQAWANQVGNIALITSSILGAVFFTILLVAGNTISQSVRERIGELGVLKAIGFTNVQMLGMVLLESCLLAILGGVLGLAVAWALSTVVGDALSGFLPLFNLPLRDLVVGAGFSVVLGLLTGFFPALQAMRLRVADALRRI